MTETAVAPAEANEPEPLKFEDEIHELTHKKVESLIVERNTLVGKANAVKGDRVTLMNTLTENDDDPEIVAARQARDEAVMLLHSLVTPKVEAYLADAAGSVEGIEEQIKELDGKIKPGLTFYKKVYGEDAAKFLPKQERVQGLNVGRAGTGGRRIRGYAVDVTVDGETTGFDNFASAAKFLDLETAQLQNAFFEAAGNPKQVKDAPDRVEMTLNYTEVDEDENETDKSAFVVATRTETEGSDEAPAADADDANES